MKHRFEPEAQQELLDAGRWYLDEGGVAVAELFECAVQRALDVLQVMPKVGQPSYAGARTWPLKRFPYTLVYRVKGEVISVMAVAHQSREPGYWHGR